MSPKAKLKITKDVTQLVLARRTRMCNFLEYKDSKVVYRRYASLFFVTGISQGDNELVTLEIIHRYVEVLDRYFGNVCELDLIFNFQKAYAVSWSSVRRPALLEIGLLTRRSSFPVDQILDELIIAGEMQESSKKSVLRTVSQSDAIEEAEQSEDVGLHVNLPSKRFEAVADISSFFCLPPIFAVIGENRQQIWLESPIDASTLSSFLFCLTITCARSPPICTLPLSKSSSVLYISRR